MNPTHAETTARLKAIVDRSALSRVDWSRVTEDSPIADLGFDSISVLDLIYDIQQDFGLQFDAEEMIDVRTMGELAVFIEAKLAAASRTRS